MTRFKNRFEALEARKTYLLNNEKAFKGNTIERKQYVADLMSFKPTDYQQDLVLGIVLSDATVDFNATGRRFKVQQSQEHSPWLQSIYQDLLEYMGSSGVSPVSKTNNTRNMFELDCLTCTSFDDIYNLTYNNLSSPKIVKPDIKPYISEVTVANWFCGDGGKRSHDYEKGITFHSQGFSESQCEILANALNSNLGLDAYVKHDSKIKSDGTQKYIVCIRGSYYDSFIEKVGPYIHPCFKSKLPSPRANGSHFGYMNEALFDKLVSSKLVGNYVDTYKRPKY